MRSDFRANSVWDVAEPEQAARLLEPKTLRFLSPFVGEGRTADEAARALGVSLTTLLYQVRRLVDARLLAAAGKVRRSGKRVTLYRTPAEAFFVPFSASPFDRPEALLLKDYDPLHRQLLASFLGAAMQILGSASVHEFGLLVALADNGQLIVRHGPHPSKTLPADPLAPDAPAILNVWDDGLKLSFADAKALQRDLSALLEAYRRKGGSGTYIAHVGLAPLRNL